MVQALLLKELPLPQPITTHLVESIIEASIPKAFKCHPESVQLCDIY